MPARLGGDGLLLAYTAIDTPSAVSYCANAQSKNTLRPAVAWDRCGAFLFRFWVLSFLQVWKGIVAAMATEPSLKIVSLSPLIVQCSECPQMFNAASRGGEALIADIVRHMLDRHPNAASEAEGESATEAATSLLYDIRSKRPI